MKKSTGILLLISFFVMVLVLVGILVTLMVYIMQGSTPNLLGGSRLALVRIEGPIYDAEDWINEIQSYQEDDSIHGLVVRIDSPGGAVGPSQELYDALVSTREEHGKVVVASFGSIAASGGYYIACGADHIVSAPGTMTGSIGVYAQFLQAKDLMEKIGIDYDTVKRGEYKTAGSFHRELEPKERAMFQGVIDDTYDQFIEAVIKGRKNQLINLMESYEPGKFIDEYPFTYDVTQVFRQYQEAEQEFLKNNPPDSGKASTAANNINNVTSNNIQNVTGNEMVRLGEEEAAGEDLAASTADVENGTDGYDGIAENEFEDQAFEELTEEDENVEFEADYEMIYKLTDALSNGKIYTGRQAEKVGLVDTIGSLDDAITIAGRLAGIRGEPTVVEKQEPELGILDLLTAKVETLVGAKKNHSPLMYEFPY